MYVGIDEVGRGCWAGPLLVVAARAKSKWLPTGLRDSKKLSKSQRELLLEAIQESCELGEGWVAPAEIDEYGLAGAMRLGVERALNQLKVGPDDQIIMDGSVNYCAPQYASVQCVPKADDSHPIVSAASVYAKVLRDNYMCKQAQQYPEYGFERHVGYGTAWHIAQLKIQGVTNLHRRSFKPVRAYL